MNDSRWTACGLCNRGGNGNDKDKCACGWQVYEINHQGCYLGEPIVGEIKPRPRLSRSKERYQAFLRADCGLSFREWLTVK